MIVPVMAISNLVLTQQIYSEETNGAHAHYREPVPLTQFCNLLKLFEQHLFFLTDTRIPCTNSRSVTELQ